MDGPKRIGFCSNVRDFGAICGAGIFDNDIEYVETSPENAVRRAFCCGGCVQSLLNPSTLDLGFVNPARSKHATKVANSRGNSWAAPRG